MSIHPSQDEIDNINTPGDAVLEFGSRALLESMEFSDITEYLSEVKDEDYYE